MRSWEALVLKEGALQVKFSQGETRRMEAIGEGREREGREG